MRLVLPLCGVLAILKNEKKFGFFSNANPVLSYFQYIFAHCLTSKLRKNKKERERNKKNNNLILRKMFLAGLELTIPDCGGQCANHCATKASPLERVFVIYKQPIFIINLNGDKTVSMQSELLACLPTL